jgi:hypothetical protein
MFWIILTTCALIYLYIFHIASWWTWFTSLIAPSEQTKHFLLTHFNWFWWIINNVPFITNRVMRAVYFCK